MAIAGEKATIYPGESVGAVVVWRNDGSAAMSPEFMLELRRSGFGATWDPSGAWYTSSQASPGEEGRVTVTTPIIPGDWGVGTVVDVGLLILGIEGHVEVLLDVFEVKAQVEAITLLSVNPYIIGR